MQKTGLTKMIGLLTVIALSGFAVAAFAAPGKSPAALCKAERADANFAAAHGGKTFKEFYGAKKGKGNAFGKCVLAKAKAAAAARKAATTTTATASASTTAQNTNTAAAKCRAEREDANFAATHSGKTFAQHYGANGDLANAFGKCVAAAAKA
jgi:hypothetical protein